MDLSSKQTSEERIAARWQRIQQRRQKEEAAKQKPKNGTDGNGEDQSDLTSTLDSKIRKEAEKAVGGARKKVSQQYAAAIESVTAVRVDSDKREIERRLREEERRKDRQSLIEREREESSKLNTKIDAQWSTIASKTVPQEMDAAIKKQEEKCAEVIHSKIELIRELEQESTKTSEEYTDMLRTQEQEISLLLNRMHDQFDMMQNTFEQQLNAVEEAFLKERQELLEKNKKEIDGLFQQRRAMEMEILRSKGERDDKFQRDLDELRRRDAEDYNKLKMNLENNIQLLEQQLEEMRATYQLNTEKLNYNFQVLKEREKENMDTVDHQKRKLKRLMSSLLNLKQKYAAQDAKFRQENNELTEEYRRVTRQYKELQKKCRHFEKVDRKKYEEIWTMNQEATLELVQKVLQADKIIHEQVLGIEWEQPKNDVIVSLMAAELEKNEDGPESETTPAEASSTSEVQVPAHLQKRKSNESDKVETKGEKETEEEMDESEDRIKRVLDILLTEAGFLIDPKVREHTQSAKHLDESERNMVLIDSLLKTLGVEDRDDLEEMVAMFYGDQIDEETGEEPLVHPNDFIKVLRKFVSTKQAKTMAMSLSGPSAGTGENKLAGQDGKGATEEDAGEKQDRKRSKDREFWTRLVNVIDDNKLRVWNALERSLPKYVKMLEERAAMVEETNSLRDQNAHLKALLDQYLNSKINDELNIPPTHVIEFPKFQ